MTHLMESAAIKAEQVCAPAGRNAMKSHRLLIALTVVNSYEYETLS